MISDENISLYRVPQGSTLGPRMFTIYISPFKCIIEKKLNVKYHIYIYIYIYIYADDIYLNAESCHHKKLMLCE